MRTLLPFVESKTQLKRRRGLEAMGALVVLFLIFFHTAMIFASEVDFPVKNEPTSLGVTLFLVFCAQFGMPLIMLIAGMAIWFSLRKRSSGVGNLLQRLRPSVPPPIPPNYKSYTG